MLAHGTLSTKSALHHESVKGSKAHVDGEGAFCEHECSLDFLEEKRSILYTHFATPRFSRKKGERKALTS